MLCSIRLPSYAHRVLMAIETLLAFFASALVLAVAPGPDNVFVLTQAALHGRKAGLSLVLGLCSGLIVHTAAVALGVAVIFQRSQLAFDLLKYAGASYLLYLAWGAFRANPNGLSANAPSAIGPALTSGALFRRGVIMNITNPKVSIFFLAFLPQFVDQKLGNASGQIMVLGALFMLAAFLVFALMAVIAARLGAHFRQSARAQTVMNRMAGMVFVILALSLVFSSR